MTEEFFTVCEKIREKLRQLSSELKKHKLLVNQTPVEDYDKKRIKDWVETLEEHPPSLPSSEDCPADVSDREPVLLRCC